MPIEISVGNHWTKEPPVVVSSMLEVESNPAARLAYSRLSEPQRVRFGKALVGQATVPLSAAIAEPIRRLAPPPRRRTPEPALIDQRSESGFIAWLRAQLVLVNQERGLNFGFGASYELRDGTVSVPVCILRDGKVARGTKFVFHYHPGVKGPTSSSDSMASKGHFKPTDGKRMRARDWNISTVAGGQGLYTSALRKAKAHRG